ncbi:MAG: outer membrane protein transport protein [Alphaproteobacteria bacterium]|nr:outer membrane protein transport protein [Alphaproteobacteria bacterium]
MNNFYKFAAVSAFALICADAHAAGYQLNEYSVTGLGRSFAGVGVAGDDYSAIAYNPAGMTLMKRSGVQVGTTITQVRSKAQGDKGEKTDMDFLIPLPSAFGQYNVNDKLFLGAGVYVPFGLATRYKHDSFIAQGKTGVRKSELEVIDFNFSGAYKLNNNWSFGASAIFRRITGSLTSNLHSAELGGAKIGYSDFRVKGYTGTFNIGAMYEFNENARVGLSYRHKSIQKTSGKHYVRIDSPYNANPMIAALGGKYHSGADPELPASIILSGYFKTAEKWATTATVKYTLWHRFGVFPGKTTDKALLAATHKKNLDVEYRWKDAWNIALGEDYYLNDNWTLRAGVAYDQSPSRSNTYRTNRIPDTDRVWVSFGASYQKDNYQIDFGYAHLFFAHGRTRNSPEGDVDAKYRSYSNMLGMNFQYKF